MTELRNVNLQPDVLVIGGGAAGILAAASAARLGASVIVVRKGDGATALSSGAVDIADAWHDSVPGPDAPPLVAGLSYVEGIAALARRRPSHPYARIGEAGRTRIHDAMALFRELAPSLELGGKPDGTNHVVVSPLGTTKRSAWLPAQGAVDLSGLSTDSLICIANFEDLANFSGVRASETLRWISGLGGHSMNVQVLSVPLGERRESAYENGRQMALALDEPQAAEDLAKRIQKALVALGTRPDLLLVPAVLGIRNHAAVRECIVAAAACPVREMLSFPPSAPGARLTFALEDGAASLGIQITPGTVFSANVVERTHPSGKRHRFVQSLNVRIGKDDVEMRPRAVILASGRFWAGGLTREGPREEPIFSLPVVCHGVASGEKFVGTLTADRPEKEHELFRSGIAYSASLQPLAADGECAAKNLFAAGSILEGYDPAKDGSGLGVCALTALLAGEGAAVFRQM